MPAIMQPSGVRVCRSCMHVCILRARVYCTWGPSGLATGLHRQWVGLVHVINDWSAVYRTHHEMSQIYFHMKQLYMMRFNVHNSSSRNLLIIAGSHSPSVSSSLQTVCTMTTALLPSHNTSTSVSRQPQLRTGEFCQSSFTACMLLLMATNAWRLKWRC